ncbi:MAG: hypothetical protein ACE5EC_09660, partial [Phycisphaerae bacterium]
MFRPTVLCFLGCVLGFCAGCERASEPVGRAAVAKAGLMPGPEAGFESIYVANQSEVKLVPAREVTYEPLESFVKEDAPRRSRAVPRASKSHSAEKPKSFVGKTRQLLSGLLGRKKAGSRPHPDGLSAKSDSDESDDADIDEDSGEDESASADEDFDEDESASADEDEDSDEDESASAD